jgi:hypothetical protein
LSLDVSRWLPAGDFGVLIERSLVRLRLRAPVEHLSPREHEPGRPESSARAALGWPMRLTRAGEEIVRFEARLASWPVAGALWLLLLVILIALLAASNH